MSEYREYGGIEEDTKELMKKVSAFYNPDFKILYEALYEVYQQGYEDGLKQSNA